MIATPTDRGIAFFRKNADGTSNVYVACGVDAAGSPEDVVAIHFNRSTVTMDRSVRVLPARSMTRTADTVHVWADQKGAVHIRDHHRNPGP